MEHISVKALLFAFATASFLLSDGVNAGCCAVNTAVDNKCLLNVDTTVCTANNGLYSAGSPGQETASWTCVNDPVSGLATCVCPPGAVCGDPHITGFDGSSYILWGQKDAIYDILSERNHQVNARLFDDPPPADSSKHESHALFIDAVGIMINDVRISVRMVKGADTDGLEPELAGVISSTPNAGTNRIAVSTSSSDGTKRHAVWTGKRMPQQAIDSLTSYRFLDANRVVIRSSQLVLTVQLQDNHHLDFQVNAIAASWRNVHGVLGQTYASAFGISGNAVAGGGAALGVAKAPITKKELTLDGKEEDYITSGLLSADDKFSRFIVGGSKLHVLVDDASAVSRKMLTELGAAVGGMVGAGHPVSDIVWTDAGVTGDL